MRGLKYSKKLIYDIAVKEIDITNDAATFVLRTNDNIFFREGFLIAISDTD
jgi:hypothetical protein